MTDTIQTRTFTINIDCNSAAFDGDDCGPELARILHLLAHGVELMHGKETRFLEYLFDINGNRCGDAEMFTETYSR
jgi:hypothetical protein